MEKQTQCLKILQYLCTHKRGLTPMDAIRKWGITKLSTRIGELKNMSDLCAIKSVWVHTKTRRNVCKRYFIC